MHAGFNVLRCCVNGPFTWLWRNCHLHKIIYQRHYEYIFIMERRLWRFIRFELVDHVLWCQSTWVEMQSHARYDCYTALACSNIGCWCSSPMAEFHSSKFPATIPATPQPDIVALCDGFWSIWLYVVLIAQSHRQQSSKHKYNSINDLQIT